MEGGPVVEEGENGEELPALKQNNTLPIWGNKETMNINQLILKNIRSSPYFKQDLYRLKTYHEVVDEIYYKVRLALCGQGECVNDGRKRAYRCLSLEVVLCNFLLWRGHVMMLLLCARVCVCLLVCVCVCACLSVTLCARLS